jgi:hypothetical protein
MEDRVEVTDVLPRIWYPGEEDRKSPDPSFKFEAVCRLLTDTDLVKLEMLSYDRAVFPATISHLSRGGKVTAAVVLGEARLDIDVRSPHGEGGYSTAPGPYYRLSFEARRMKVTPP